jgi:hypothetical protein
MLDPFFAGCLLAKGRRQIEVCRFAMDKLQNDECKRFAQAEIDEHQHIKQRLGELGFTPAMFNNGAGGTGGAGTGGSDRSGTSDRSSGTGDSGSVSSRPRNAAGTGASGGSGTISAGRGQGTGAGDNRSGVGAGGVAGTVGGVGGTVGGIGGQGQGGAVGGMGPMPPLLMQIVMVDQEVAEQCIATAKAEMGKLQGPKFDMAFIGDQLHEHYGLFDHAVVFRNHAARIVPVLNEGRPIIERHIATCKELKERLANMRS